MIGAESYTVGHGDGDTTRPNAASDDVGAHGGLPKSAGHPFYERLGCSTRRGGVREAQCASFYADGVGGRVWRRAAIFGCCCSATSKGVDSERAIAWRAADSLSIRAFLDYAMHEAPPDHTTLSRTRRLIDLETHQAVFTWVLQRLADATLVVGRTVGIDATTLEANAAMRSIVRRDTGESYDAFLTRLAEASGLSTPTRAELARFDRTRKKKGSNADWQPYKRSYGEPDAKIAKMQLHGPGERDLKTQRRPSSAVQPGRRWRSMVRDQLVVDAEVRVNTSDQGRLVTALLDALVGGGRRAAGDRGAWRTSRYHSNETMDGLAATVETRGHRTGIASLAPLDGPGGQAPRPGEVSRDESRPRSCRGARGKRAAYAERKWRALERLPTRISTRHVLGCRRSSLRGHPNMPETAARAEWDLVSTWR